MSTSRSQRIGIWVIAVALLVGTVFSFFGIILANSNQQDDQQRAQAAIDKYQKDMAAYNKEVAALDKKLSKKYYDKLVGYKKEAGKFAAKDVKELKTRDIVKGDGKEIKDGSSYSAYYVGWRPDGKVFDSSIQDGAKALKTPLSYPLITGGDVVAGWKEGVKGMKAGGVREITIPADKAYGEEGSGELIPPNTPLRFIIVVMSETYPEAPEYPAEMLQ